MVDGTPTAKADLPVRLWYMRSTWIVAELFEGLLRAAPSYYPRRGDPQLSFVPEAAALGRDSTGRGSSGSGCGVGISLPDNQGQQYLRRVSKLGEQVHGLQNKYRALQADVKTEDCEAEDEKTG
jgi:hypothetical protein